MLDDGGQHVGCVCGEGWQVKEVGAPQGWSDGIKKGPNNNLEWSKLGMEGADESASDVKHLQGQTPKKVLTEQVP
eukprot:1156182-Pelagomonas_calceolata.AAC.1